MKLLQLLMFGALLGAVIWSSDSAADILPTGADGWHTWQVDEPGASTGMCCFAWKSGDRSREGCSLDGRSISFSNDGDCAVAPGTVQVYVRLDDGVPEDIYVLSSNCPVSTESAVADHGLISTKENMRWFRTVIEDKELANDVREEALFALITSSSDAVYAYLDKLLTSR
jgi:hypothetical protein